MREDKLGDMSMELSVDVLQLTKELRSKHENVISNQISRSATSICANIAEANTLTVAPISLQSSKSHSRKQMKQASGLKCFIKASILMKQDIKHLTASARQ